MVPTQVPIKHLVHHNMELQTHNVSSAIAVEHAWRPLPHNINNVRFTILTECRESIFGKIYINKKLSPARTDQSMDYTEILYI